VVLVPDELAKAPPDTLILRSIFYAPDLEVDVDVVLATLFDTAGPPVMINGLCLTT